jgi:hypothetical protein
VPSVELKKSTEQMSHRLPNEADVQMRQNLWGDDASAGATGGAQLRGGSGGDGLGVVAMVG